MPPRSNPLTPQFGWNEQAQRYVRLDGSFRFVAGAEVRATLDVVIERSKERIADVSQRLHAGQISVADWQRAMMMEIKSIHTASAAAAAGGWAQMTPALWGATGRLVRDEYAYLRDFVRQIASGEQRLDGDFLRRARMYGDAGRGTYHALETRLMRNRGWDEEASVLGVADHCQGCLDEAARGFVPIGSLVPIGDRQCRSNCKCRKKYRNSISGAAWE
jgi:hypothetical protein